jgi:hypothetical protein
MRGARGHKCRGTLAVPERLCAEWLAAEALQGSGNLDACKDKLRRCGQSIKNELWRSIQKMLRAPLSLEGAHPLKVHQHAREEAAKHRRWGGEQCDKRRSMLATGRRAPSAVGGLGGEGPHQAFTT